MMQKFSFPNILKRLYTVQKMKFSIKDFFSKRDQIRSFLRIWSHLLKKSLMENFIFCAVLICTLSLNKTSILQISLANSARTILRLSFLNFS